MCISISSCLPLHYIIICILITVLLPHDVIDGVYFIPDLHAASVKCRQVDVLVQKRYGGRMRVVINGRRCRRERVAVKRADVVRWAVGCWRRTLAGRILTRGRSVSVLVAVGVGVAIVVVAVIVVDVNARVRLQVLSVKHM